MQGPACYTEISTQETVLHCKDWSEDCIFIGILAAEDPTAPCQSPCQLVNGHAQICQPIIGAGIFLRLPLSNESLPYECHEDDSLCGMQAAAPKKKAAPKAKKTIIKKVLLDVSLNPALCAGTLLQLL